MILELIKRRRAVYPAQYNKKPISKEILSKILEAANWAPTHKRTEPWRFKVLLDKGKNELGSFMARKYQEIEPNPKSIKIKKLQENPQRAAAVILICMQRDPLASIPEWEEIAATSMAVQNMWLMCTELGIGSYWSSPALISHFNEFTELEEGERCLGIFYMGYYDMAGPEIGRGSIDDKVVWID